MMRAGKLRHLITLQRNEPDRNSIGDPIPHWVDYATVNAEVSPLKGREFFDAQQITSELTTRVRIRWLDGVKAEHRILFQDRTLEIASPPINVDEKKHELILMCRELQ